MDGRIFHLKLSIIHDLTQKWNAKVMGTLVGSYLLCVLLFCGTSANSQSLNAKVYQDQQRALRLSLMREDIKSLDDAPLRCFVRTQIVKFIFQNKVTTSFDTANDLAVECFEDISKNAIQYSEGQRSWQVSTLLTLLRFNSPDVAAQAEKKYSLGDYGGASDFQRIQAGEDLREITNGLATRIARGQIPSELVGIFGLLRQKDPALSYVLLDALAGYLETTTNIQDFGPNLSFFAYYYLDDSTPVQTKLRFLRFVVKLGQDQLSQSNSAVLYQISHDILRDSLPKIEQLAPSLYSRAQAVFLAMDGKTSASSKEEDEVFKRINDSKDKLQQAISEAETAVDLKKAYADSLWQYASEIASGQKKFQIAVDCVMKYGVPPKDFLTTDNHPVEITKGVTLATVRDHILLDQILPKSLRAKDFDSSVYIVKYIENDSLKATGTLQIAAKYLEVGNKPEAYESMGDALKLLENGGETPDRIRLTLSSVPIAMGIEKSKAFEAVSLAIRMINRLPALNPEDRLGTDSRLIYVDGTLMPTAYNLERAFKILTKSDVGFAASIAQEIQRKDLRLVTDVIVETERLYPLDKEVRKTAER